MHSALVKTHRTYKDITDPSEKDQNNFLHSGPCGNYGKKTRRHVDFFGFTPSPDPLIFFDPFKVAGG
jgi:hypothetical protein